MPTARHLRSVAHNIAHHAASGMSFLHPHACRAARAAGLAPLVFDLLKGVPIALDPVEPPLRAASEGLGRKFTEILHSAGFQREALASARLYLLFPTDEYYCLATCRLTTAQGKELEGSSSSGG
jgi:hypothetical protein